MVVAIALAFSVNYLVSFDLRDVLNFIFAVCVVIWFWWGYVMDRLAYPPRSARFPLADVLVLIFISLIPFSLRQGEIYALSGTLAAALFAWALMINGIVRENRNTLDLLSRRKLQLEVEQRVIVGLLLVADAVIDLERPDIGFILLFVPGVFAVVWSVLVYFTDTTHSHPDQSTLHSHI